MIQYTPGDIEEILGDLRKVGPEKPVGYLQVEMITEACGQNLEAFVTSCQARGNIARLFKGPKWPGRRGSLYVYHRPSLQSLLDQNQEALLQAGWPRDADRFVENLHNWAAEGSPMSKLIARAFANNFGAR